MVSICSDGGKVPFASNSILGCAGLREPRLGMRVAMCPAVVALEADGNSGGDSDWRHVDICFIRCVYVWRSLFICFFVC